MGWRGLVRVGPPSGVLFGVAETVPRPLVPLVQDTRVKGAGGFVWKNSEGGRDDENTGTMFPFALLCLGFTSLPPLRKFLAGRDALGRQDTS